MMCGTLMYGTFVHCDEATLMWEAFLRVGVDVSEEKWINRGCLSVLFEIDSVSCKLDMKFEGLVIYFLYRLAGYNGAVT